MADIISQIYFPKTMNEFFSALKSNPQSATIVDGVTLFQKQRTQKLALPETIISLENIDELHRIDRTDRFLEIGVAVTLNQILNLKNFIPSILISAIKDIETLPLRNLITIGSCIWRKKFSSLITAAMIALDARYELRSSTGSRWIKAEDLLVSDTLNFFSDSEIFARVRLPLNLWDYCLFKPINPTHGLPEDSGIIVFLALIQDDILSRLRIVFSGDKVIQNKNIEAALSGKKLPLAIKEAKDFINDWKKHLEDTNPFIRDCLINFIESAIMHFVD